MARRMTDPEFYRAQPSTIERAIAALEEARNSGAAPVAAARDYVDSLMPPNLQKLAADLLVATIDT